MAIRVALNHKTSHRYARPVWLSPHVVRLRPAPHCRTPILSYSLRVTPQDHFVNWQQDPYSNHLARLVFPKPAAAFSVEVDLVAELSAINPFDFFVEGYAGQYPFRYEEVLGRELAPYLEAERAGPMLAEFVAEQRRQDVPITQFLVELNQTLSKRIKYGVRLEPGVQTPEHTLTCLGGSCRDSSWLLVQVLRHLGLAARFVSGYLIQLVPDAKQADGSPGIVKDFTDLHAWAEVYVPGAGWIGLDPTSGLLTAEGHIPLACTAQPMTAAPVAGSFSPDDASVATADTGEVPPAPTPEQVAAAGDEFHFSMSLARVHEDPRVTKPYTEEQWAAIRALGRAVDADLMRGDVRLTMGGEPTFVSVDNVDAPEWQTAALGEDKYRQGDELVRRLRERFAPGGGFVHHGQGKWYPGEPYPRWALGLYWRKDGKPIWKNAALLADESEADAATGAVRGAATEHDALLFATHLAGRLGVSPKYVQPGHEDVWFYLWKEQRLPVNVDPFDSKLSNPLDRARLARIFEQGLEKVVGFCLPLRRRHHRDGTGAWVSGPWFFRPERMYLVPGDSPMGLRLPLDSLPWVAPEEFPFLQERDPWERRGPLPDRDAISRQHYVAGAVMPWAREGFVEQTLGEEEESEEPVEASAAAAQGARVAAEYRHEGGGAPTGLLVEPATPSGVGPGRSGSGDGGPDGGGFDGGRDGRSPGTRRPALGQSSADTVRTALCTQVRNGVLRVFVPPVRYLEDYLELIAAIEDSAAALKMRVLVEGYTPPSDPRITDLKVTPDPGVIEVNAQPAESWDELLNNTLALDEEARACRLRTEKFMADGRHVGTGGGNHMVFGAATPADSPFLRRPDLLRSMLGFWHNHPSLSYAFSGMFVGPTSQAPRVDEARNDQVYELELAFRQVPGRQIPGHDDLPPWLVDRVFRNLLVDVTGNTHRAEFCIDKLYAPESPTGRLGLLEMRGFEMPPHPQMSLAQAMLLRALIARFWQKAYEKPLVRWRTEIHDRFLLPHFVRQDFADVIDDLNDFGYGVRAEWFDPHLEFRFPLLGTLESRGVVLQLRQAIEPWHVLGETPGISSTVRFVDPSLERVEVKVDGMTDSRHVIACNGVTVPMHPTGTNGQFVAGVRYRAWRTINGLHPTIPAHAPLTFDLFDTWSGRSVAGCRYHVSHPGGRNYRHAPVNAAEAESRRVARFFRFGHTPGPMHVVEGERSREFPFTLDMRQYSST